MKARKARARTETDPCGMTTKKATARARTKDRNRSLEGRTERKTRATTEADPCGMTTKKATAKARAKARAKEEADSSRE
jgi:hypothetical protein